MKTLPRGHREPRLALGTLAIMAGCLLNYVGNKVLGIRVELYYGLETFNFLWFLAIFILPALVGILVSYIFGFGGKWLAHFPPLIVLTISYFESVYLIEIPVGAQLMPMAWWGFFVILAIECGAAGGVMGEIFFKAYDKEDEEQARKQM